MPLPTPRREPAARVRPRRSRVSRTPSASRNSPSLRGIGSHRQVRDRYGRVGGRVRVGFWSFIYEREVGFVFMVPLAMRCQRRDIGGSPAVCRKCIQSA